jgi:hypothetical protein
MKKLVLFVCVVTLMFGTAGVAKALTFVDTTIITPTGAIGFEDGSADYDDHGWGAVHYLDWAGDYVAWTHHFEFDPPAAEVLSGTLRVFAVDDEPDQDWWTPWGTIPNVWTYEVGFGIAEDGTWDFGEVDTNLYTYNVTASYLIDGTFSVGVASVWGDFYIAAAQLEINYEPVPEPGTILLLGAGLIGLIGLGRKKFSKK